MTVKLLTDQDLPYSTVVPGMELARSITHAGTTQLGGGYMRFSSDAEFADWTLKYDEVYRNAYRNFEEARHSISEFLDVVYNQHRLHSALGYCTPAEFEEGTS